MYTRVETEWSETSSATFQGALVGFKLLWSQEQNFVRNGKFQGSGILACVKTILKRFSRFIINESVTEFSPGPAERPHSDKTDHNKICVRLTWMDKDWHI